MEPVLQTFALTRTYGDTVAVIAIRVVLAHSRLCHSLPLNARKVDVAAVLRKNLLDDPLTFMLKAEC